MRLQSPSPTASEVQASEVQAPASDFRARLRSVDPCDRHPLLPNSGACGTPQRAIEQFHADFIFEPSPPPSAGKGRQRPQRRGRQKRDKAHDALTELTEAFTQAGSGIHASAVERLVQAHAEIESQIASFHDKSSATLASSDALYDNIEWPLSKTLCSGDGLCQDTVARHLANLAEELKSAEDKLGILALEWDACLHAEESAWSLLCHGDQLQPHGAGCRDKPGTDMAAFKTEAQCILKAKMEMLDHVEEEHRESVQSETAKILESMFN